MILINRTASIFNNTFTALDERVKNLDSKIKQINKTQKNNHNKQNEFNDLATQTTKTIKSVDRFCKYITQKLLKTNSEHVLEIIPFQKLKEQVNNVQDQLLSDEKIPSKTENFYDTLKLLKIDALMADEYLIIRIGIPIIKDDVKVIYKLTPVPVEFNSNFKMIHPLTQFAIIPEDSSNYTPLTTKELESCIKMDTNFICTPSNPTFYANLCELSIYKEENKKTIQNICTQDEILKKNYVTPLYNMNTFFLTVYNPIVIHVNCADIPQVTKNITQSGILYIPEKCEVNNINFHIKPQININQNINLPIKINSDNLYEKTAMDNTLTFSLCMGH